MSLEEDEVDKLVCIADIAAKLISSPYRRCGVLIESDEEQELWSQLQDALEIAGFDLEILT